MKPRKRPARHREFRRATLVPALVPALQHEDWAPWSDAMDLFRPSAAVCEQLVASSAEVSESVRLMPRHISPPRFPPGNSR